MSEYLGIDRGPQEKGRMWFGVSRQSRLRILMCSNVVGVLTGVIAFFALTASSFSAGLGFLQWLLPVIAGLLVSLAITSMGNAVAARTPPER